MVKLASIDLSAPGAVEQLAVTKGDISQALLRLPKDMKGVRLDLSIELPDGTELLVDFSDIHPTTVSCLNKLETFV